MTPYAVLLVKPTDTEDIIRAAYHALARESHPDKFRNTTSYEAAQAELLWTAATTAYTLVKTESARAKWAAQQYLLSGMCATCSGYGVTGTRLAGRKIRVCASCSGEGRSR